VRILLVNANRLERESHAKLLEARHHRVEHACDCRTAMAQLEKGFFEVMLLDSGLYGESVVEILKRMKSMPDLIAPYVVVASERNPGTDFELLYEDGMCDFIRKPFWREELIARVEAPARLRLRTPPAARDWTQACNPLAYAEWADLGAVIGVDLSDLTAHAIDTGPAPKLPPTFGMAARIALIATASETEIRLTMTADHGSLFKLAEMMLGVPAPDKAVLEDLLREVANTAAGAMKRAAPPDEALTTGLPETVALVDTFASFTTAPHRFALRIKGQPIELSFAVEAICRGKHRVPASDLKEGMVLVRDLRNDAGLLLVPSGTRLTVSAAERVSRLLGRDHLVEVSAAA
jgi:CheY-like chemotaxis protein